MPLTRPRNANTNKSAQPAVPTRSTQRLHNPPGYTDAPPTPRSAPKMSAQLSVISFLCLCILRASALESFPEKFVAGVEFSSVTLTCDTATDEPVEWTFFDDDVSDIATVNGKELTILNFEADLIGNYTCWSKGKVVDHTYVLHDQSDTITDQPISCTAETFNCTSSISCTMNLGGFEYYRLRNKRDNGSWVSPSNNEVFLLNHSTHPFAEEAERMVVIGEAMSSSGLYFTSNYSFYLRDIIKPGSPKLSLRNRQVVVDPPVTWTMPLSYYPLEHEIQIQKLKNNKTEIQKFNSSMQVTKGIRSVRVRCRDSLLLSQWSEWTQWENVGKRRPKNRKKQKDEKKRRRYPKKT